MTHVQRLRLGLRTASPDFRLRKLGRRRERRERALRYLIRGEERRADFNHTEHAMASGSRQTGTSDPMYNLISVIYHGLQGAENYARYAQDAEQAGDAALAGFFREAQTEERERADRAKDLLSERLSREGGGQSQGQSQGQGREQGQAQGGARAKGQSSSSAAAGGEEEGEGRGGASNRSPRAKGKGERGMSAPMAGGAERGGSEKGRARR